MTELSHHELIQKVRSSAENWRDIIPPSMFPRFVNKVEEAISIYLELVSPQDLRSELIGLEKATRSHNSELGQSIANLSPQAKDILSRFGPLPTPPNSTEEKEEYRLTIRSRLILSQRWVSKGGKRRRQTEVIGPPKKLGRPAASELDVLVSFISAAYAYATGEPTTRHWDDADYTNIERIIDDCFYNLLIDDRYSSLKATQRHIRARIASSYNTDF